MKTFLISTFTATLLGFAFQATARSIDAADFTALMFAIGLVAWTINQYNLPPLAVTPIRPVRLPVRLNLPRSHPPAHRLAA